MRIIIIQYRLTIICLEDTFTAYGSVTVVHSHAHFDCDTFIYECTEVRGAYVAVVADYVDQAVAWADPGYAT